MIKVIQRPLMTVDQLIEKLQRYRDTYPDIREALVIAAGVVDDRTSIIDGSVQLRIYRPDLEQEGYLTVFMDKVTSPQ